MRRHEGVVIEREDVLKDVTPYTLALRMDAIGARRRWPKNTIRFMDFTSVACNELLNLAQLVRNILVHEERVLSCTFKMVAYYLWLKGFLTRPAVTHSLSAPDLLTNVISPPCSIWYSTNMSAF